MSEDCFLIGEWYKERDTADDKNREDFPPPWCEGCVFIAGVCHGGEDGCSLYDNYKDVCTVHPKMRSLIGVILDGAYVIPFDTVPRKWAVIERLELPDHSCRRGESLVEERDYRGALDFYEILRSMRAARRFDGGLLITMRTGFASAPVGDEVAGVVSLGGGSDQQEHVRSEAVRRLHLDFVRDMNGAQREAARNFNRLIDKYHKKLLAGASGEPKPLLCPTCEKRPDCDRGQADERLAAKCQEYKGIIVEGGDQ